MSARKSNSTSDKHDEQTDRAKILEQAQLNGWTLSTDKTGDVSYVKSGYRTLKLAFSSSGKLVRARTYAKVFLTDKKLDLVLDHLAGNQIQDSLDMSARAPIQLDHL